MMNKTTELSHLPKLIGFLLATVGVALAAAMPTVAVDGSRWSAGRIIDDQVFYNKDSMNVEQIQHFIDAKVVTCDNMGTQHYSGGQTVYEHFHPRGVTFPITCLEAYYENPTTLENNLSATDGQTKSPPADSISAAQIIWNAAQEYGINPQVLITLLQKEQGLVLDTSPLPSQYRSATGYGCSDTATCNSKYYGFYNQIKNTARQFRLYTTNPNNYNYVAGDGNAIRWNPNSSCGSKTISIANQATAALYNYTPYQPNQAALNNLYGTGDSCSDYGNRNFWRTFHDWFGSPLVS